MRGSLIPTIAALEARFFRQSIDALTRGARSGTVLSMPRTIVSIFLVLLGAATSAFAEPRAYRFETGLQMVIPDTDAPPTYAVKFGLGFVMDDTFVLDLSIQGMSYEGLAVPNILDGQLGVRYQIDVTRWIPSIRLGVGAQAYLGSDDSVMRPHSGAFAQIGFGLLYAVNRSWMVGGDFSHMAGLAGSVGGQRRNLIGLRLVYQKEP